MAGKNQNILFLTGRLAESSLRQVLARTSAEMGFDYDVVVLPITVAALMTPQWIERNLPQVEACFDRVILPGYCAGDLGAIATRLNASVELGPKDLRRIPEYFGADNRELMEDYDVEIIAEINHAPRLQLQQIAAMAQQLAEAGADVIDVGCDPGYCWSGVGDCVRSLKDMGLRVSIDSFDAQEVATACAAGAELVLSVNESNRQAAVEWGVEVVAIPDTPSDLFSLDATVAHLEKQEVQFRIDPILEPIGCGFTQSLVRYSEVRSNFPEVDIMMGIGNITELTDCDSAAVNFLLLGICQELRIRSVLTTQVINWARTSVREIDIARRLVYFAVREGIPPKNLSTDLVMLRDARPLENDVDFLAQLAQEIRDHNLRIFAQHGACHIVTSQLHLSDENPFKLFQALMKTDHRAAEKMDSSHAFYLGYEMAKAVTALTLGKQYTQDESLDWGFLTEPERTVREETATDDGNESASDS